MSNIFDETGVVVQGISEFRDSMSAAAKISFADKLDGKELRTDDSSVIGRLFATVSKSLVENAEILPMILQSFDINQAEGQQLDNLLWNIHRIKRNTEAQSTGYAMLYGDIGTYVSQGTTVGNSNTGDTYKTDSPITFSRISANGVEIKVDAVSGYYQINYSIDGYLSESPPIVVETGINDTTIRKISDRIVSAVNNQSSYLYAVRNNDNSVVVYIVDQSRVGDFSVDGLCTITRSYMPVYITSKTYNAKESLAGEVTTIQTAVLGLRGVINPYYIYPSASVESDENYRARGKLLQNNKAGKYTSIVMAIKSVSGVIYENVQQNTSSNTTNSGITNNGVAITVMGGNEDDIALAIFDSISEGIETSGDIEKYVKDINGFEHIVRFSRPKIVPLEITMSLVTYPNFPTNGNAKIRQAIIEWFNNLDVGEDIHHSRLYEPINSIQGFAVKNMQFGYKDGTLSTDDVIIRYNEIATLNSEDIIIGGSVGNKNAVQYDEDLRGVVASCESTGVTRFVQDGFPPALGTAKYRINGGEWYTVNVMSGDGDDTVTMLLKDINSKSLVDLFYTGDDGDGSKYPFYRNDGAYYIVSGELFSSDDNYYQYNNGEIVSNIVEFQTTSGGLGDLVQYMFGGNKTITSCVLAEWTSR